MMQEIQLLLTLPGSWTKQGFEKPPHGFVEQATGDKAASGSRSDHHAPPLRVLIVDDEQLIADTLVRILTLNGFIATAVYNGEAALAALATVCPNIVLTDVRMPGRNGIEVGILIREQCPETRVVLFSGQAGVSDLLQQARDKGHGFELWPKPLHPKELVKRLRK